MGKKKQVQNGNMDFILYLTMMKLIKSLFLRCTHTFKGMHRYTTLYTPDVTGTQKKAQMVDDPESPKAQDFFNDIQTLTG